MTTVAITGVGGPAGIAVSQALKHHVIGLDADEHAAGFHFTDAHEVIKRADDPLFADSILSIVDKWHPNVLVSTICEEYTKLWNMSSALTRRGCHMWLPSVTVTTTCLNKWIFANVLANAEIPHPDTALRADLIKGPWVIKPRFGRGSRGIRYVDDISLAKLDKDDIIQTQITGREFTADCLVGRDGVLHICAQRWRLETRGGISTKGETFDLPDITAACGNVLAAVGLTGVANVQGFVNNDGVTILECNPRFSGGLPLTVFAGANIPEAFVNMTVDASYEPKFAFRPNVRMDRYFGEVFTG